MCFVFNGLVKIPTIAVFALNPLSTYMMHLVFGPRVQVNMKTTSVCRMFHCPMGHTFFKLNFSLINNLICSASNEVIKAVGHVQNTHTHLYTNKMCNTLYYYYYYLFLLIFNLHWDLGNNNLFTEHALRVLHLGVFKTWDSFKHFLLCAQALKWLRQCGYSHRPIVFT